MVVLSVSCCPPSLKGDLSKWLNEINTGVYIGRLSARVRDELWKRICENIKDGQATMIFSAANAQGYKILVHNTSWKPVDYDGIILMKRPLANEKENTPDSEELKPGFSKASKYQKAQRKKNSVNDSYVILDIETTGLDPDKDLIIEIGMIRVREGKKTDGFRCYVRQERKLPEKIVKLTGITDELLSHKGMSETDVIRKLLEFAGRDMVVGYNIRFDMDFVLKACERYGIENTILRTKDVMALARRKIDDISDFKLETLARYFKMDIRDRHEALSDCALVYGIYTKLNEI